MKKILLSLTLALTLCLSLCLSAAAAFVPDDVVYEERDGHRLAVRTYTLLPGQDPSELIGEDFTYDGFRYSYRDIVKEEQEYSESKEHTETVTVTTASEDPADILARLAPTLEYDDGTAKGTLTLERGSVKTEAAGYEESSRSVTATKNYTGLARNDSSCIDKTLEKDGRTLTLSNITWAVESTVQAGDELVPATYSAVATYSGTARSRVATGYITTAAYTGTVTASGISAVRYTVTYLGTPAKSGAFSGVSPVSVSVAALLFLLLLSFAVLKRSNTTVYASTGYGNEYIKCGRAHLSGRKPVIRLEKFREVPRGTVAVEVEQHTARKLSGKNITVRRYQNEYTHTVDAVSGPYWFTLDVSAGGKEPDAEVDVTA